MLSRNKLTRSAMALLGMGMWAGAQDYMGTTESTPTYSTPATPPTSASGPAVAAPRTGLYGAVVKGNAAADNTVEDYTRRPHLIGDKQYIAGWGDSEIGHVAYSFDAADFNWFGLVRKGAGEDEIRAGLAQGEAWGAGLIMALHRQHRVAGTPEIKTTTVFEGQGFGVFGSWNLGGSDVYGQLAMYTGFDNLGAGDDNSVTVEPTPPEEITNRLIDFLVGWKKDASGQGEHALNAEFLVKMSTRDQAGPPEDPSLTQMDLWFYHGYILNASDGFAVFVGSNSNFGYSTAKEPNNSGLSLASIPNMSFHKELGKGFEAQAGIGVRLAYGTGLRASPPTNEDGTDLITADGDMALGLRWTRGNFAVEGFVKDGLLANGPHFIGGNAAPGLFYQVGVSTGF